MRVLLVDDYDAGGDAGAVKEIGGQADNSLDVTLAHQRAADVGLGVAAEQHAVRQDDCHHPLVFQVMKAV